ncbi:hypothetical protein HY500_02145 [Candidatus Woesearchaeota archaeon]|nr:hypothetical protein [Candidatus Woesearchaeota archaeon]
MKKTQLMALFIIFLMVSSAAGFIFGSFSQENQDSNLEYKGQKFLLNQDGRYFTTISGVQFVFDNNPQELENIEAPSLDLFNSQKFYIIFDPPQDNQVIGYNMQKLGYFLQANNKIVYTACSEEEGCPEDLPIKDCREYSFYFKQANQSRAYIQDNCYVIEGKDEDITKFTDKIDLKLVGL